MHIFRNFSKVQLNSLYTLTQNENIHFYDRIYYACDKTPISTDAELNHV